MEQLVQTEIKLSTAQIQHKRYGLLWKHRQSFWSAVDTWQLPSMGLDSIVDPGHDQLPKHLRVTADNLTGRLDDLMPNNYILLQTMSIWSMSILTYIRLGPLPIPPSPSSPVVVVGTHYKTPTVHTTVSCGCFFCLQYTALVIKTLSKGVVSSSTWGSFSRSRNK